MFSPNLKRILPHTTALIIGLTLGIIGTYYHFSRNLPALNSLRLGADSLINPLLACNIDNPRPPTYITRLQFTLDDLVDSHIDQNHITSAGIYLYDLNTSSSLSINPDDKFYPASLNKIPIMLAAYKTLESNPEFFRQTLVLEEEVDLNRGQEITPQDTILPYNTYTVREALTKMIYDSDNNGYYALTQLLDQKLYHQVYDDLQIPLIRDTQTVADYITPENFSYFFRVLYNATYINNTNSRRALVHLSRVKYDQGLRADIPEDIPIAHKYGLLTLADPNGQVTSRELHDCGIVYYPDNPYLLCIMTKSTAPIDQIEKAIQDISNTVYNQVSGS